MSGVGWESNEVAIHVAVLVVVGLNHGGELSLPLRCLGQGGHGSQEVAVTDLPLLHSLPVERPVIECVKVLLDVGNIILRQLLHLSGGRGRPIVNLHGLDVYDAREVLRARVGGLLDGLDSNVRRRNEGVGCGHVFRSGQQGDRSIVHLFVEL